MRVHELAKELGVASKDLLASLKEMGVDGLTASSSVPDQAVPRLRASGGKAVPEARLKEAVDEPLPEPSPGRKKVTQAEAEAEATQLGDGLFGGRVGVPVDIHHRAHGGHRDIWVGGRIHRRDRRDFSNSVEVVG